MRPSPSQRTLVDIFETSVRSFGPRPFLGTKRDGRWDWVAYDEFETLVDRCRNGLASLNVRPREPIAIVSNNRVEWAVVAYACYSIGALLVPMYVAQSPRERAFILRDCGARVLVAAGDALKSQAKEGPEAIPESVEHLILLDAPGAADPRARTYQALLESTALAARVHPDPGDGAAVMYTSGTTGDPKGVVLTHRNIVSNLAALQQSVPNSNDDRSLSILPWAHAFGQTVELHGLFSMGGSVAISSGLRAIADELLEVHPTVLIGVPRVFNEVYAKVQRQLEDAPTTARSLVAEALRVADKRRSGERLTFQDRAVSALVDKVIFARVRAKLGGSLRHAISGGAALSIDVARFLDSVGVAVYEGYGLTETSPVATSNVPGARKLGSVGRAIPGVRIEIDPSRVAPEARAPGAGEIVIYGDNVMRGYFGRPDETAAAITPDGGLRTGDVGRVDEDGYLYVTGRIKEQYKLDNGKYVVPGPLEDQLKVSSYIANAMVCGDGRPYSVAVIVANVEAVRRWAQHGALALPPATKALLTDARVRTLFREEVAKFSSGSRGFETIRDFVLVADDFATDNGFLTPSLKVKRDAILRAFRDSIDALYEGGPASPP